MNVDPKVFQTESSCPSCNATWVTGEIPEKYRQFYGGKKFYHGGLIGIVDQGKDRVTHYQCSRCMKMWNRFTGNEETLPSY